MTQSTLVILSGSLTSEWREIKSNFRKLSHMAKKFDVHSSESFSSKKPGKMVFLLEILVIFQRAQARGP